MLKRSLLIGFLCIGLIALLSTESAGRCRIINGKLSCSEVCADTFLQGVGNPETNPVAVCAILYLDRVAGRCWNKPLNATKTSGTVFFPNISFPGDTLITVEQVTDKGWAEVPVCWADSWEGILVQVQEWIDTHFNCQADPYPDLCSGYGVCPNANWWFDQDDWRIEVMYVYHSSYQYAADGTTLKSTSALCRRCVRDPSGTECLGSGGFSCSDVSISECQARQLDTTCNNQVE